MKGLIGASQGSYMQASERKGEREVWLVVGAWGEVQGERRGEGRGSRQGKGMEVVVKSVHRHHLLRTQEEWRCRPSAVVWSPWP